MKYLIQGRKDRGRLKASVHLIWAQTELLKKRRKTYISMKMEPNGRIPPRQTMTAGSMNLPGHNVRPQNQTRSILCDEEEKGKGETSWIFQRRLTDSGLKSLGAHFLLAAGHGATEPSKC